MLHLVVLLLVCFLRCGSSERATRPDTDPLHVLLIPGPSEMSSRPLVGLAKELHDRGHEVSIAVLQHVQDEVIQLSSEVFGASPLGVSLEGVQDLNFLSIPVYNAELLWTWDDFRGSPDLYNRELMTMEDLVVRRESHPHASEGGHLWDRRTRRLAWQWWAIGAEKQLEEH